jgi:hypothetical protein
VGSLDAMLLSLVPVSSSLGKAHHFFGHSPKEEQDLEECMKHKDLPQMVQGQQRSRTEDLTAKRR